MPGTENQPGSDADSGNRRIPYLSRLSSKLHCVDSSLIGQSVVTLTRKHCRKAES